MVVAHKTGPGKTTEPVLLATACWWIDRGDCWEITHDATRDDAEADHADLVRETNGWVLSPAGALALHGWVARQETQRCYVVTCPECGTTQHVQDRCAPCLDECGYEIVTEQLPTVVDPDQTTLFGDPV